MAGLAVSALSAQAQVVDFEDLNNNGGGQGFTLFGDQVTSRGYQFNSTTHVGGSDALASWTSALPYYTGSCSLFANYLEDVAVMTKSGGGAFTVRSIDLCDVFRGQTGQTVTLIGTRADNTTDTESFFLSDGANLHTFALANMTNVVKMTLDDGANSWFQFDNINVVPEPTSMIALGAGVAALLRRRRK
ncbi:MAG: PEP-CTERM sorting domain-containing protein [Armatimonadetes bacterium]|nr:PEP-CTERM sorting domain-containing protein [Armatimonadota bacterium]